MNSVVTIRSWGYGAVENSEGAPHEYARHSRRRRAPNGPAIDREGAISEHRHLTALVADDEPDVVDVLAFHLEHAGFRVFRAGDGAQALALAREHSPDLALLDVMMPQHSGLDVLQCLRGDAATSQMTIILLSGRGRDVDIAEGLAHGADDYVTKPFDPQDLLARVRVRLAKASAR